MRVAHGEPASGRAAVTLPGIGAVIDALGSPGFGEALLRALGSSFGIRYMAAYTMDPSHAETRFVFGAAPDDPDLLRRSTHRYVAQFAARDPACRAVLQAPAPPPGHAAEAAVVTACVAVADLVDAEHRILLEQVHIGERIAAYVPMGGQRWIGLHLMREDRHGPMTDGEFDAFSTLAPVYAAFVTRHVQACEPLAERLLRCCPGLSAREREVCAGLLAGDSATTLAARLGVGVASVHTYRDRAYAKLGVHSMRDLFMRLMHPGTRH